MLVLKEELGSIRGSIKRIPRRPAEKQESDFSSKYDYDTLLFSCVRIDEERVIAICPPLLNLQEHTLFEALEDDKIQSTASLLVGDRLDRAIYSIPSRSSRFASISHNGERTKLRPNSSQEIFSDRRVVFCVNKDNHLDWFRDWATHYILLGANGLLVYDNSSTLYTVNEIQDTLRLAANKLGKDVAIGVCQWPFKFGPSGAHTHMWDSNYAHHGMLEDARWRFLKSARSVLSCDLDELCHSEGNLFDQIEQFGYLRLCGEWVAPMFAPRNKNTDFSNRSYGDFPCLYIDPPKCPDKWGCVPSQVSINNQWTIHNIIGITPRQANDAGFYHFTSISTSWDWKRDSEVRDDPSHKYRKDSNLELQLDRIYSANLPR